MATITTAGAISIAGVGEGSAKVRTAARSASRPRKVPREQGKAIEMLGHAIEYLGDEFALECLREGRTVRYGKPPQIVAIEILMAKSREVYFSCPVDMGLSGKLWRLVSALVSTRD